MLGLLKKPEKFIPSIRKSRKLAHTFEMVRLSVSLFQLTFIIFPYTSPIFRIVLVMRCKGTDGIFWN